MYIQRSYGFDGLILNIDSITDLCVKGIRVILVILLLISCSVEHIQANQENDVLGTIQSSQSIEASNLSGAEWPWAHGCSCTFNDMAINGNADDGDL